jgi:GNAT superfamily N-acetyltransferase
MAGEHAAIRRATVADARELAASRYRFRTTFDAPTPPAPDVAFENEDAFVARAAPLIAEFLGSGRWQAWVAERDGGICGHLFLQLIDKMPNPDPREPERLGYLTSFFVEPELRDRAVGSALMQELEAFATRSRVEKILIVGTTQRSRSLYARRGYASSADLLQKRVPASSDPLP